MGPKTPLLSAWRPLHRPSAQNMHMEMRHGLAAVWTIIDDKPKARFVQAFLFGDRLRDMNQVAQKRFVGGCGGRDARDFSFGDDQYMDRGLGMHIVKRQATVVLISDPGRNFAGDDLRENGAHKLKMWFKGWLGVLVQNYTYWTARQCDSFCLQL